MDARPSVHYVVPLMTFTKEALSEEVMSSSKSNLALQSSFRSVYQQSMDARRS
jgi:hypothetical protein